MSEFPKGMAFSRALLGVAPLCRTALQIPQNMTILRFRFVPLFAGVCRALWRPKGKKRATCRDGRQASGRGPPR
jgi:hypothetical protein